MLTVAASIYGVLVYTVAFSLEIWFIFNNDNSDDYSNNLSNNSNKSHQHHHNEQQETQFLIPMTALIQASIYFVLVILSLFLVLGVIIKSIVCLLCWIIAIILAFLPECALVVYTALNVWKIDTRNGQIEICFFVFRFIMNTFFVIFVYNLIKQWKTEKIMSNYMIQRDAFSAYPYITTTSLRLKKNPTAILPTVATSNFDTFTKYNTNHDTMTLNDLAKFKSLSVKGLYDMAPNYPYYTYFEGFETHLPQRTDAIAFPSEFDTNSFRRYKMIRKPMQPIDLEFNNDKKMIDEQYYSKKSLVNELDSQSISNSINNSIMNSIGNQINMMEQNQFNQFNDNVVQLRQLSTRPFDYLRRPGSVMNLTIPYEADENYNNIMNERKDSKRSNKSKSVNSLRDVAL